MTMPRQRQHDRKASTEEQRFIPHESKDLQSQLPSEACSYLILGEMNTICLARVCYLDNPQALGSPNESVIGTPKQSKGQHLRKIFYHAHLFTYVILDVDTMERLYFWRCGSLIGSNESGFHKNIVQMIPGFG